MSLIIDHTHLGRAVTGVERIAIELFDPTHFAPEPAEAVTSRTLAGMVLKQQVSFLARGMADRRALALFPGFPPSPLSCLLGRRCIAYIHDTFPLTRPQDMNWKGRLYTAPTFRWALRRLDQFFVNSLTTGAELRRLCRPGALIAPFRAEVRNVFGLAAPRPLDGPGGPRPLRLVALGTIEPRKNHAACVAVAAALNALGWPTELHIVGRVGWGQHAFVSHPPPFLTLHGYLDAEAARAVIKSADALISMSHAEGLGLPLLEVQHGGLPVIAPEDLVFREVLGDSALLVRRDDPASAAAAIAAAFSRPGEPGRRWAAALDNVARWNALAREDARLFRAFLIHGRAVYEEASAREVETARPCSPP